MKKSMYGWLYACCVPFLCVRVHTAVVVVACVFICARLLYAEFLRFIFHVKK